MPRRKIPTIVVAGFCGFVASCEVDYEEEEPFKKRQGDFVKDITSKFARLVNQIKDNAKEIIPVVKSKEISPPDSSEKPVVKESETRGLVVEGTLIGLGMSALGLVAYYIWKATSDKWKPAPVDKIMLELYDMNKRLMWFASAVTAVLLLVVAMQFYGARNAVPTIPNVEQITEAGKKAIATPDKVEVAHADEGKAPLELSSVEESQQQKSTEGSVSLISLDAQDPQQKGEDN